MKENYENRYRFKLTRRTPIIVRVDGKAFHSFTKYFKKPFDSKFSLAMRVAASLAAEQMQGFKAAYIQSDEINFLITDYDSLFTEAWFDYNKSKIESVTASMVTCYFGRRMSMYGMGNPAFFDARAFNLPIEEVSNYFLWRAQDWQRNSIMMVGQSKFSHKELHGKNKEQVVQMLLEVGHDWNDYIAQCRNGTFLYKSDIENSNIGMSNDVRPNYAEIDSLIRPLITHKQEK
jgi:tRNA(His) 5'-end guanylyltransferase